MNPGKATTILILSILGLGFSFQNNNFKVSAKDFEQLIGNWEGSLTYLDYSTGKPYTMQADIEITRIEKTNSYLFVNKYPKEPRANSADTMSVSKEGKYFGRETVTSKKTLAGGIIEIITEEPGKDGNDDKPAVFKHTYTFGKTTFSNRKDVQFVGETEWIKRHEYTYTRKKSSN